MKKIFFAIILLILIIALVGCGPKPVTKTTIMGDKVVTITTNITDEGEIITTTVTGSEDVKNDMNS